MNDENEMSDGEILEKEELDALADVGDTDGERFDDRLAMFRSEY